MKYTGDKTASGRTAGAGAERTGGYGSKKGRRRAGTGRAAAFAALIGAAFWAAAPLTAYAGSWVQDENGDYRYYEEDGTMLTNTVTPDGYYVDDTGVWIQDVYDVSQFTTIPEDAGCLMVIEGHGTAARAAFYVKNSSAETQDDGSSSTGSTESTWTKVTDTGAYVGRNGIGKEAEGDEKTPRGLYTLDEAFGTMPDPGTFSVPYLQVDDGYYWVGDSTSQYYNQMVDIRETGEVFDTEASEQLSTYGGKAYNYCVAVGYNKEQTPYKGSAIFLHCMDGPGTGGCIAIPEEAMVTILENISGQAYILIDDAENLANY